MKVIFRSDYTNWRYSSINWSQCNNTRCVNHFTFFIYSSSSTMIACSHFLLNRPCCTTRTTKFSFLVILHHSKLIESNHLGMVTSFFSSQVLFASPHRTLFVSSGGSTRSVLIYPPWLTDSSLPDYITPCSNNYTPFTSKCFQHYLFTNKTVRGLIQI